MARKQPSILKLIGLIFDAISTLISGPRDGPPRRDLQPPSPPPATPNAPLHRWPELGEFDFEVVGESHYQTELRIVEAKLAQTEHDAFEVRLHLEDSNPHDSKAVAVLVGNTCIAYLSKDDARSYRRRLAALRLGKCDATCGAKLTGGYTTTAGDRAMLGVVLDLARFD